MRPQHLLPLSGPESNGNGFTWATIAKKNYQGYMNSRQTFVACENCRHSHVIPEWGPLAID